jgi:hypothetical protein
MAGKIKKLFSECKSKHSPKGLHSRKRESFSHVEVHDGKKETHWTHIIVCGYGDCNKILSSGKGK